jgi:hypothetical protein
LSNKSNKLLLRKKSGLELGIEPKIPIITDFIEKALQYFEDMASAFNPRNKPNQQLLEDEFIKILDYVEKNP